MSICILSGIGSNLSQQLVPFPSKSLYSHFVELDRFSPNIMKEQRRSQEGCSKERQQQHETPNSCGEEETIPTSSISPMTHQNDTVASESHHLNYCPYCSKLRPGSGPTPQQETTQLENISSLSHSQSHYDSTTFKKRQYNFSAGNGWTRIGHRFTGDAKKASLFKRQHSMREADSPATSGSFSSVSTTSQVTNTSQFSPNILDGGISTQTVTRTTPLQTQTTDPFISEAQQIFETNYACVIERNEELYFIGSFALLDDFGDLLRKWTRIPRRDVPPTAAEGTRFTPRRTYASTTMTVADFSFPVKSVATGLMHALVVDSRNRVWICGTNERLQLGLDDRFLTFDELTPLENGPLFQLDIVQVACGKHHSVFLQSDLHTVWICGDNMHSQNPLASASDTCSIPLKVCLKHSPIHQIGASSHMTALLNQDKSFFATGDLESIGVLMGDDLYSDPQTAAPKQKFHHLASNVIDFSLGFNHILVLQEYLSHITLNLKHLQEEEKFSDCEIVTR